jgi:phosphohistidine swiveling domain-containing protein
VTEAARTLRGLGASPGVAHGRLKVLARGDTLGDTARADTYVLCTEDPTFCELASIQSAAALVLLHAGATAEGAIVARTFGKPCVVGFPELRVIVKATGNSLVTRDGIAFPDGTEVHIDAGRGLLIFG